MGYGPGEALSFDYGSGSTNHEHATPADDCQKWLLRLCGYAQTFPQELLLTSRESDVVVQSRVSISQDGLQYERSGGLRLPDGIFLTSRWDSVVIEDTQRYSKLESVGLDIAYCVWGIELT